MEMVMMNMMEMEILDGGGNDWDGACHTCPDSLHPAHIPHDLSSRVKVGKKREGLARGGRGIKCKGHQLETFILESKWACLGIIILSFRLPLFFPCWIEPFVLRVIVQFDLIWPHTWVSKHCPLFWKRFFHCICLLQVTKIGPLFKQHDCIGKSSPWTKHLKLPLKGIRL